MAISTRLRTVYASAPTDTAIIATLDMELPGEHVRLVDDFEDMTLGVNGVPQVFEACGLDIALPTKDNSGNQSLQFALGILDDDRINELVVTALDADQPVYLTYREYLSTDTSAPAAAPIRMTVLGGEFNEDTLGLEASYYDLLNTAWPRERYTLANAPGIKYL